MSEGNYNQYLDEVLGNQLNVEKVLKSRNHLAESRFGSISQKKNNAEKHEQITDQDMNVNTSSMIDYRITGKGRKRTVVVPPNCYVIHTRLGSAKPLHIGLGISFQYDQNKDSFLLVPASMQTIIINARCICMERQGILVQAYVQWIISDIETAYKKLDFNNMDDPMKIVNIQLREQAEAAIKDKVSTMHVDEVLTDKQPIIEELTSRLRQVAEGSDKTSGLGLKIVTVQIKEAVVSSSELWENLQKPFRAERERQARLAEMEAQKVISEKENQIRQQESMLQLELERELQKERISMEQEAWLLNQEEELRRIKAQLELIEEQRKLDALTAERNKKLAMQSAGIEELKSKAKESITERELNELKFRKEIENMLTDEAIKAQLIEKLSEIAANLPVAKVQKNISITNHDSNPVTPVSGLLSGFISLLDSLKK